MLLKPLISLLGAAAVLLVIIAAGIVPPPALAQDKPANVRAANGANAGEAIVSWDAVDNAAFYRIGWVAFADIETAQAAGRHWLDAFAFADVANLTQTAHTLTDLKPDTQYAFIVGSVNNRFGIATWSDWTYLTLAAVPPTSCPPGEPSQPTPMPGGTPTPTPSPSATPAADATPTPTPDPSASPTPSPTPTPTPATTSVDYDRDNNGLIEIASLAQLDAIRHDPNGDGVSLHSAAYDAAFPNPAANMGCLRRECQGYELVANLDFDTNGDGAIDDNDAYWEDGYGWIPIGEPENPFNTTFDGNGHTIANLYIRWTEVGYVGFFRATGEDAVIRNLGLTDIDVTGGGDRVGGIAGDSAGAIANSYTTGRVSGGGRVGGVAGFSAGDISDSHSAARVTGSDDRVGGLIGSGRNISDSHATGAVAGEGNYVGGLVGIIGSNVNGIISRSYATGTVTGEGNYVGGLAGSAGSNSSISRSYATGSVTSGSDGTYVGGLVGGGGNITASYATGSVTSDGSRVGGLAGWGSNITASYATGSVTSDGSHVGGLAGSGRNITASYATGSVTGNSGYVGGLVGYQYGGTITASYAIGSVNSGGGLVGYRPTGSVVTDSYWDTQTTGRTNSSGGIGKTTRELQLPTGPTGIYANWNPDHWDFGASRQYPALKYDGLSVAAQRQ